MVALFFLKWHIHFVVHCRDDDPAFGDWLFDLLCDHHVDALAQAPKMKCLGFAGGSPMARTIAALMIVFFLPLRRRKKLNRIYPLVSVMLGISLFDRTILYPCLFTKLCLAIRLMKARPIWPFPKLRSRVRALRRYERECLDGSLCKSFLFLLIMLFWFSVFFSPCQMVGQEWYNRPSEIFIIQEEIRQCGQSANAGSRSNVCPWKMYEKKAPIERQKKKTRLYVSSATSLEHAGSDGFYHAEVWRLIEEVKGIPPDSVCHRSTSWYRCQIR